VGVTEVAKMVEAEQAEQSLRFEPSRLCTCYDLSGVEASDWLVIVTRRWWNTGFKAPDVPSMGK
jgi:hypothetical protein